MVPWISVLLTFPVTHVFAAVDRTHGVAPELLARYKPIQSGSVQKWKCLDDSKEIPWDAVNDDYCECTDGSDEPGPPVSSFLRWRTALTRTLAQARVHVRTRSSTAKISATLARRFEAVESEMGSVVC